MPIIYAVLLAAALITSIISGIIGMGGGILLLATIFCFLPHAQAIPLHAAVQIASNSTRMIALIGHVDRPTLGRFCLGALPGAVVGFLMLQTIRRMEHAEPLLKMAVGAYVLVFPFLSTGRRGSGRTSPRAFTMIGLLAGVAALTVGAVGPLIAPMFLRHNFVKERLVATKAACQMVLHVTKIPAFLWIGGWEVGRLGMLAVVMCVVVVPGTLIGRSLLARVSESQFVLLYRIALLVAGCKVLGYDGIWAWIRMASGGA